MGGMTMEEELTSEMLAARAKLRERFGNAQLGGKGTARRKTKKVHKSVIGDDKKLQLTLKRLGVNMIYGIEDVFMLQENGKTLQFSNPKVQACPGANVYVVSGPCEEKSNIASLLGMSNIFNRAGQPGGLNFDPNMINPEMLRQLQEQVNAMRNNEGLIQGVKEPVPSKQPQDDEDVPELQVNFEDVSNK